ncbi:ankyrin repeat protein [Paramyrothecium foliicola]|nr:ankyrin repeat protein [Paramyrothecium foliicola]
MDSSETQSKTLSPSIVTDLSHQCSEILDKVLSQFEVNGDDGKQCEAVRDSRARFKVWASNIGALQPAGSTSSIAYRLRNAPLMRQSVASGLQRLLGGNISGKLPSRTYSPPGHDGPPVEELDELLLSVASSVSHLFNLSILIRRQRPKGRLPTLDGFRPVDKSPDISSVMDKFPKSKQIPWLAERLGNATTQRRQLIQYRQSHRERLRGHNTHGSHADDHHTIRGTVATTFDEGQTSQHGQLAERETAALDNRSSQRTMATSFFSTASGSITGRRVPDLSDMKLDGVQLNYGEEFECPYCRTIQLAANRYEWKYGKHLFSDLLPYVCTFQECSTNHKLFSTRAEWFQHELQTHRRQWLCHLCARQSSTNFPSEAELKDHINKSHTEVTSTQMPIMIETCEQSVRTFDATSCPLCDEWRPGRSTDNSRDFSRHVARHLQHLALDALPLSVEGLEICFPDSEDDERSSSEEDDVEDQYNHAELSLQTPEVETTADFNSDTSIRRLSIPERIRMRPRRTRTMSIFGDSQRDALKVRKQVAKLVDAVVLEPDPPVFAKIFPISAEIATWQHSEDRYWFILYAKRSNGHECELSRSYNDFYDMQLALLEAFPGKGAAATGGTERIIPYMPGPVPSITPAIMDARLQGLNKYLKELTHLTNKIVCSQVVVDFFTPREGDFEPKSLVQTNK